MRITRDWPYPGRLALICTFGIFLNIAGGLIGASFGSLLFLDMVGTAYVALLSVLPAALFVAFASSALLGVIAPFFGMDLSDSIFFSMVNCIGAIAWSALPLIKDGKFLSSLFNPDDSYPELFKSITLFGFLVGIICALTATLILLVSQIGFVANTSGSLSLAIGNHPATESLRNLAEILASFFGLDQNATLFWTHIAMGIPDKMVVTAIACGLAYAIGVHPNFPKQVERVLKAVKTPADDNNKRFLDNARVARHASVALIVLFLAITYFAFDYVEQERSTNFEILRSINIVAWFCIIALLFLIRPRFFIRMERKASNSKSFFHTKANAKFISAFEDVMKIMSLFFALVLGIFAIRVRQTQDAEAADSAIVESVYPLLDGPLGVLVALTVIRYFCCFLLRFSENYSRASRNKLSGANDPKTPALS